MLVGTSARPAQRARETARVGPARRTKSPGVSARIVVGSLSLSSTYFVLRDPASSSSLHPRPPAPPPPSSKMDVSSAPPSPPAQPAQQAQIVDRVVRNLSTTNAGVPSPLVPAYRFPFFFFSVREDDPDGPARRGGCGGGGAGHRVSCWRGATSRTVSGAHSGWRPAPGRQRT